MDIAIVAIASVMLFALAEVRADNDRIVVTRRGASVEIDVRAQPRRDVLDRLFNGTAIRFQWLDAATADVSITGRFAGTPGEIARKLLADTDFVVVYDRDGATSRISRVVIVGPSSAQPNAAASAALEREQAPPPVSQSAPTRPIPAAPLAGNSDLPLRPVLHPENVVGITPPPPGSMPPALTPPPDATPPLLAPPPGVPVPQIAPVGRDAGLPIRPMK